MEDVGNAARKGMGDVVIVTNVASKDFELRMRRRQVFPLSAGKIIQHPHLGAAGEQAVYAMGTNKSGTAGNEAKHLQMNTNAVNAAPVPTGY